MGVENRPGSLTMLPDDELGRLAIALVIAEVKWSPDVAPAVLDRASRDAVAYPDQFDRRPAPTGPIERIIGGRSPRRMTGRLIAFAVIVALIAAIAYVVASANPAAAADSSPAVDTEASASPGLSSEPTPHPTFDPGSVTVRVEPVATGFSAPVYLADDGDSQECLYVVERAGTIDIIKRGLVRATPFLDISGLVSEGAEQGLHSIAFHPDFSRNGRFFVHYNDVDGHTTVEEYRGKACRTAEPKAVKKLLKVEQPRINNNGGWLGFGPDGYLYIPLGDGGGVAPGDPDGLGQDKATLLSKVLRIDVDKGKRYAIPKSNPFATKRLGYPREALAWGLRDPRRASFDRLRGDLWIGDVGEDRFEEVDRLPAGEAQLNYGWSDMEGDQCHNLADCDPADYTLPTHFYDSVSPHCGIVGGYVYRGEAIPELSGVYLFSDFCSGFIWGLDAEAVARGETAVAHELLDAPQRFVSFGEADDGELYLVALDGGIFRIEAERAN